MCINLKKKINRKIKESISIIIACTENIITSKSSHLAIAPLAATYKILNLHTQNDINSLTPAL